MLGQGLSRAGHVARPVPLDGMEGLLPLPALDDVAGPGKGGRPASHRPLWTVFAAAVVEVEVAVDDDVDRPRARDRAPRGPGEGPGAGSNE